MIEPSKFLKSFLIFDQKNLTKGQNLYHILRWKDESSAILYNNQTVLIPDWIVFSEHESIVASSTGQVGLQFSHNESGTELG